MSLRVRVDLPEGTFTPTADVFDQVELRITCDHCFEPLESSDDCLVWLAPASWDELGVEPHTVHASCVPDFVMERYLPKNHPNLVSRRIGELLPDLAFLASRSEGPTRAEVLEAYAEGLSERDLANRFGVSRRQIRRIVRASSA